jgi:lantibiotic biosynthesis protein
MRWLAVHIPHGSSPVLPPRPVHHQAMHLADPREDYAAVCALPGGDEVVIAWRARAVTLARYRDALAAAKDLPTDPVLASLLHMHVIRVKGLDPGTEQTCHHLTRSAAVGWLARHWDSHPCASTGTVSWPPPPRSPAR